MLELIIERKLYVTPLEFTIEKTTIRQAWISVVLIKLGISFHYKAIGTTLGNHSATLCHIGHADAERDTCLSATSIRQHNLHSNTDSYRMQKGKQIIFKFIYNSKVTYYPLKLIIFIHFIPFSFLYFILRFSHILYIG